MDKRLYICAAIILFLAALGLLAYNTLEIYPRRTFALPSREALANNYYAMERWLKETGHPVRVEKSGSLAKIASAKERVVLVHASACEWENADEIIVPWIEQGGYLVISLDYNDAQTMDENLLEFLSGFGISAVPVPQEENPGGESIPDFFWDIHFLHNDAADIFTINGNNGYAGLAEVLIGDGALTVISRPWFMYNNYLGRDVNARLAWDLTGARATSLQNTGVLFVLRDKYVTKALFGKIMERGNPVPVVVSALLVIFLGFWMVIPVFGLMFDVKQRSSRPIRERFTVEIRFLKKYGALNHYLEVYERELKLKGDPKTGKKYRYRELINKLRKYESIMERI